MGDDSQERTTDETGSVTVERQPSAEVFKLLASDARIEILEALGDPPGRSMSFSALYERTSIKDSGNFSYHLNELLGTFVRKDDGEYLLSHAGEQVFGSIEAGTYQAVATVDATEFGGTCQLCGGDMLFEYANERAKVYCAACEKGRAFPFPPARLSDYDLEALPAASARWYRTLVKRILDGFCPVCAGRMTGELVHGPRPAETPTDPAMASFTCDNCGKAAALSAATIATFHPIFEGFLFEHGFDTRSGPHSEVWDALADTTERTHTRDPLSVEVTFTHEGETVTGIIDANATITAVERQQVDDA